MNIRRDVIAKMIEMEIKDFSDQEIDRVFSGCIGKELCKRSLKNMVSQGLTFGNMESFMNTKGSNNL